MDSRKTKKFLQKFLTILSVVAMIATSIPVSEFRVLAEEPTTSTETTETTTVPEEQSLPEEVVVEGESQDSKTNESPLSDEEVQEILSDFTLVDGNGNPVTLNLEGNSDASTEETPVVEEEVDPSFEEETAFLDLIKQEGVNDWITPDYQSYDFYRDAELVAFIDSYKNFADKDSFEFMQFLAENLYNVMDLAYMLGDNELVETSFSGAIDYNSLISAQELYNSVGSSYEKVKKMLNDSPEDDYLKAMEVYLSSELSSFNAFAKNKINTILGAASADIESIWVTPSSGYCTMLQTAQNGGGTGTVVVSVENGSGEVFPSLRANYNCSSTSCTITYVESFGNTHGLVHWTPTYLKQKGNCVDCPSPSCNADSCSGARYRFLNNATANYGVALVWDTATGNPVYCTQPDVHITKCSVITGNAGIAIPNPKDTTWKLAAVIQAAKGTDSVGNPSSQHITAAKCVWTLLGIRDVGCDFNFDSVNNSVVHTWTPNMQAKDQRQTTRVDFSLSDSAGVLDKTSGYLTGSISSSNYNVSASGNLTVTRDGGNKVTHRITDPYPLKKSVTVSPAMSVKEEGSLAGKGSLDQVIGPNAGIAQLQNFLVDGQFEPGSYKADKWFGDSYNVYQKSGSIKFSKISERTNQPVSCPYVDVFGVSHECNTTYKLYMEVNENDPTWKTYNGTSIDLGAATRKTYDGKTYQQVQISADGSGNNGTFQQSWALAADGSVTIGANSTYGGVIPEGTFYLKEASTNNKIWDLNPKYYQINVVNGQVASIASGTNSSEQAIRTNFSQAELGALQIVKYTAAHTTTNDTHTDSKSVGRTKLTSNLFQDGFGNKFDYRARFRLYIDGDSPLWGTDYDYTAKVDPNSAIEAEAPNNNSGTLLHVLRVDQDVNNTNNTAQYEYSTSGNYTWEWQTVDGLVKINSIPVRAYADNVDEIKVWVKEVWVNTDFQTLDRDYHDVIVEKNANNFASSGRNMYEQTNDLYASLEIDKYIMGGVGKNLNSYERIHAADTYKDSYGDTYDSVFEFALYIDKDSLLWESEYDCSHNSPSVCPVVPANDKFNTTGKELHRVRIYKDRTYPQNALQPEANLVKDGNKVYEYKWSTSNGHIDITQIPIFPRNYVKKEVNSGRFYLKEILTNDSIFQIDDYRELELSLNTNTRVAVDNIPNGTLELHKFDEDSMPDGTPRKVTSDYCSSENIEQGTYCDLTTNKALSDYFVLLIDETSPLWNLSKEESDRLYIGAYDAGAYYAYDEDWGKLGYISSYSLAKDDKHDYQGSAQNSAKSGSEMYEIDFSQNQADSKLHVVKIKGYNDFTGPNKDVYTASLTEKYEDDNNRVFEAGIHWRPDANGDIYIKYLPEGSYYLKEHSVDPNVFSLDEYIYKVEIETRKTAKVRNLVASELDPAPEWTFANTSIKTGGLEFVKLDEEGYNAGAGHKFRIWYVNDKVLNKKEAQQNGNSIQNSKGQWGKDISNSYELARTVSAKKKYLSGYLENNKQIPVDENNKRLVLFQINYDAKYFEDHPGHYKYKGTGEPIDVFETDEKGRIYIERLPIGTYIIEEIETRENVYDHYVDDQKKNSIFEDFKVEDDQGRVFQNAYRFSVDYKLVTCLNSKTNKAGKFSNVCTMVHQFKNKNNTQVPSGLFADTQTRTNEVKVGEHNAEVTTTFSFDSTLKTKETLTGIVNEWAPERGSLELTKYDEYGNTGTPWDVQNKVFELYYLDENDAFNTITGNWFVHDGTYTPETIVEHYNVPEEIQNRLSGKVLALQVDDVQKEGVYTFKHWDSATVKFDEGKANDAVYQFITGADGKIKIDQVPVGEYLVIEIGTTNAFLININGETVVNVQDGKTTEQDIVNYFRNVDIEVLKQREDEEFVALDDARFVVYDITDTFSSDYSNPVSEELIFARTNKKIDLYNLLIKGTDKEAEVANKTLKYSLDNVDYAYVDSDRYLIAGDTGKVNVTVMYGVHSLYGNLAPRTIYTGMNLAVAPVRDGEGVWRVDRVTAADLLYGNVEVEPGYELKLYKDAALKEPVTIQNVQVDGHVDLATPGKYTLTYKVVSLDHVVYTFDREITVVDRDRTSCMYYPQISSWRQDRNNTGELRICADLESKDPVYKAGPYEGAFDGNKSVTLIPASTSADNGKVVGNYDIYVIKDGAASNGIITGDAGTKPVTKVFEGITGHITLQLQDYADHNYPIANGKLVTYKDPELTQVYKTYNADELGMVDLTVDAGKVDKLYFPSKLNPDGYYSDIENVVEIDMSAARPGYLQIKNLKHSRKYIVCEVEAPNGYDFNSLDNACVFVDTGINGNWGEEYKDVEGKTKRIIYRFDNKDILKTLQTTIENVDTAVYATKANEKYSEENFDNMIQKKNNEYDLFEPDTNEEKYRAFNNMPEKTDVIITKHGAINNELINTAIFDVYEEYANGEKYIGRYSSGAVFQHFQDDEGKPIVGKKVLIAKGTKVNSIGETVIDPETIEVEVFTDKNGNAFYSGLPNGNYVVALERPLKDGYQPCQVTTVVDEYCNPSPSDNDYVPFADLPKVYAEIFEAKCTFGELLLTGLRVSSTYRLEEVAAYSDYFKPYAIPDDDVVYKFKLDYSNMDFNQGMFIFNVTNYLDEHNMKTTLTSADRNSKEVPVSNKIELVDVVEQSGLTPNVEYELRAVLMDKKTEKPFIDADGNEVRVTVPNIFSGEEANDANGRTNHSTWEVVFEFNGKNIKEDTELVAFEYLYNAKYYKDENGETYKGRLIDSHEDINDEGQTIKVIAPEIRTTATNAENGEKVLEAKLFEKEPFYVKDVVAVKGAIKDHKYKLVGWLMDKTTKEKVVVDGEELKQEITFTAEATNFEKEMLFEIPGELLNEDGHQFVVFEHMYELVEGDEPGVEVEEEFAEHEDITDEGQTITVKIIEPKIKTKAADIRDEDQTLEVYDYVNERLVIKDTISYENLKPDYKYIAKTWLVDAQTGEVIKNIDGSEARVETPFEVETANGTFDVEIPVDTDSVAVKGYKFVIFEEVYVLYDLDKDGTPEEHFVGEHKDLTDENQTITVEVIEPKIRTKAVDAQDSDKYVEKDMYEDNVVSINDTVIYENLKPGETYKAKAYAMDKKTQKELLDKDGNVITAEKEFKADENGEVVVEGFKIDIKDIEDGAIIVMFEELYHVSKPVTEEETPEETLVAEHKDINDKEQSIEVFKYNPSLKTHLAFLAGGKTADTSAETIVVDVVEYKDFKPNTEYRMVGQVFDKETKKLVATGETIFKTEDGEGRVSGKVEVKINLGDTRGKEGKYVIAFEDAYEVRHPEWHVSEHKDWNDADQTVQFNKAPEIPKKEEKPKTPTNTGAGNMVVVAGGLTIAAAIALAVILSKKKKNS